MKVRPAHLAGPIDCLSYVGKLSSPNDRPPKKKENKDEDWGPKCRRDLASVWKRKTEKKSGVGVWEMSLEC
jgi:hypothetical protein